jgi:hypothetical protein
MQLDLEKMSQLLRHNQVFLILVQIAVFAILPELKRVPTVGLLETGESDTRDIVLFGSKKACEGLGEPISKHLNACGWNVFALSLESLF